MVETMGACMSATGLPVAQSGSVQPLSAAGLPAVEEENPREQHITPRIMPVVKGGVLPTGDGAVREPTAGGDSLF